MWAHMPLFGTLIWPWPIWPWLMRPLTFTSKSHVKYTYAKCIKITFYLLVNHIFGDPNSNGSWDMNYCPVISVQEFLSSHRQTEGKRLLRVHRALAQAGSIKMQHPYQVNTYTWYHFSTKLSQVHFIFPPCKSPIQNQYWGSVHYLLLGGGGIDPDGRSKSSLPP